MRASVPVEMRDHLFEPFESSREQMGVGLPTARMLLREAGGDVELVTTGPQGSRFRCTLPRVVQKD